MLFLNCERTCGLTDVPASIYDRKTAARPFDTNHNILRCLSLSQFLLKGRNAPIWRMRAPAHMRLLGTDGLKTSNVYFQEKGQSYYHYLIACDPSPAAVSGSPCSEPGYGNFLVIFSVICGTIDFPANSKN